MNRLIAILSALSALSCANVASAQTMLETFEDSANTMGYASFVTTFDIESHDGSTLSIDSTWLGMGWSGAETM